MHADHPSSANQARISVLAIVWIKLSTRHVQHQFCWSDQVEVKSDGLKSRSRAIA